MKLEEEQRVKERIRDEEFAAANVNKSQENASRPLATVTPRENNNSGTSCNQQDRKERERQREKRRSEREANDPGRKTAIQLPNESSSGRGVKVHTVSPLYASYPVMADRSEERTGAATAPESAASISPNPPAEEEKRTTEFSLGALEAMAALKQRVLSPPPPSPPPPEEEPTKQEEEATVPLDLSEASVVRPEVVSQPEMSQDAPNSQMEDSVRSLLDVRVERWKRKRQHSDPGEEVDDDLDEEINPEVTESALVSLSVEQCLKKYPIPVGVSEEQHHFLHMFGLVTPKKRSGNPSAGIFFKEPTNSSILFQSN